MAEGLINVDNAVEQEQRARQQLDEEFAPNVMAARDEAEDLPELGRRLQREWESLVKVAGQLPEANKSIAALVEAAHKTMTGGIGTPDYGVPHHAMELIQGPEGSQRQTGKARRVLKATNMLAVLTPESRQWAGAYSTSEEAARMIGTLGGLVKNVIDYTAKVPESRFDGLTGKAAHASDELRTHIGKL